MSYIQPDSKVWICKGIPLTPDYDNTMTFKDKTTQANYFIGKAKTSLINYSIIKDNIGAIRVNGPSSSYEDVNYVVFTNPKFSNKYFYAFIMNVEYVNPSTTILHYEIDVMQTWLFDFIIKPSLVEREHVEDDRLYQNLQNEGIEIGERIKYGTEQRFENSLGDKILVMGFTEDFNEVASGTLTVSYHTAMGDTILNISDERITYNVKGKYFSVPVGTEEFTFDRQRTVSQVLITDSFKAVYDFAFNKFEITKTGTGGA